MVQEGEKTVGKTDYGHKIRRDHFMKPGPLEEDVRPTPLPPGGGRGRRLLLFAAAEATDVTAGRRFVLLSFFYGEQEAKLRDEYNRRVGGAYRA
jgi:hypothetical protein